MEIKQKGVAIDLFDNSDSKEVESEIMSLAFKAELEKKKGNEGEEGKGKGGKGALSIINKKMAIDLFVDFDQEKGLEESAEDGGKVEEEEQGMRS